ncbi:MAG: hypothetical protein K0Q68_2595 [Moraxellaceae bacterium]|jgi:hypothetical protein|nr:hypothetical protein [Moraxellaceae bacterium]
MKSVKQVALLLLAIAGSAAQAEEGGGAAAPTASVAAVTTPEAATPQEASAPQDPEAVAAPKPGNPKKVAVYIYRTGPYLFGVKLKINDELALKFIQGYSWFELDPGIYRLAFAGGLGNPGLKLTAEQKIEAGKGPYYLHAFISGMGVGLREVSETSAQTAMRDLGLQYLTPVATDFKPLIPLD